MTKLSGSDEAIAQRVAELMRGPATPDTSKVVTQHHTLRCKACGETFPASHENPHAGGCGGNAGLSHNFYGKDSETVSV